MTVYTFDKDRAGKSVCYRGCASTWPPVAAADIPLGPDFGVVTRGDGTGQAGYRGKPLYLYSGDKKPGDTSGDSIQSVWHVIPRNAVSSMSSEPETIWRGSSYLLR
jgi:predicted lipoprotein with Yx(FWY)xxD motif